MAAENWWADKVQENLSQGDVLADLPFLLPEAPLKYLRHTTLPKQRSGWVESTTPVPIKDGRIQIAGLGKRMSGIVLSHDCELDKARETPRVVLGAVMPMTSVAANLHDGILRQQHAAFMPLPDLPGLGTSFLNLRMIVTLDRNIVTAMPPVASMTESAKKRLQAQLIQFFTRLNPELD